MARFAPSQSWDEEDDDARTIEVRSDARWKQDTDIEVHPHYAASFDADSNSDAEWEKPTTTFVAPAPFELARRPSPGSSTDWIGPQRATMQSAQPAAPPPQAFDAYAVAPAHDVLAKRIYDHSPINSGPTTEYYAPEPPPPFESAPPPHSYYEPVPVDLSQSALVAESTEVHRPSFSPAPTPSRSYPQQFVPPSYRPRMESVTNTSTWKKTIPALRRMVGLPVVAGFGERPRPPSFPHDPPASVTDIEARRFSWPPAVLIAMAVGLVAMVVISIVGLGTRAAGVARAARERVVTASATGGDLLSRGSVFVDGGERCASLPCELTLADGAHWITVRADGFETPPARSVRVGANEPRELHFDLVPATAVPLVANVDGPIDPATLPTTPAAIDPASPAPAPKNSAERATARAFGMTQAQPAAGATARLNINAVPFASVVLDGKPIGQTPRLNVKVKPGAHSVIFVTQDGRRTVRGTAVAAGETATVSAKL